MVRLDEDLEALAHVPGLLPPAVHRLGYLQPALRPSDGGAAARARENVPRDPERPHLGRFLPPHGHASPYGFRNHGSNESGRQPKLNVGVSFDLEGKRQRGV